jgi:RHS repeat-associated protein
MTMAAQLSENSHQGFDGIKAALYLAAMQVKSNTASGMPVCLRQNGIGSRSSGKERDAETGLDYFGARYYSGAEGRFISPDPKSKSANPAAPQSWNRYAYTHNNPLKFVDPDGMDIVLAKMNEKDRSYVVNNLARLYATDAGRAFLERADRSKFTVEIGVGKLAKKDLTPHGPEVNVLAGDKTYHNAGRTNYSSDKTNDGHTILVANSPDSSGADAINVLIDRDRTIDSKKDPAKVLAHEIGGHTSDILDLAESKPEQFIDSYDPNDETSSEAAEKKVKKLPGKASSENLTAVEELLRKKGQ